ncbi:MAG: type II secretion system protein GspG [SAR324 cluster bacterium]|nr:type II secretion system protein GspG [SAR324 cluster bacterium]
MRLKKGFTLMEILLSLGVLSVLTAVIMPMGTKVLNQTNVTGTQDRILLLEQGLLSYFRDMGKLPNDTYGTSNTGLDQLITNVGNVTPYYGPYVTSSTLKDSWNQRYVYDRIDGGDTVQTTSVTPYWAIEASVAVLASNGANHALDNQVGTHWILQKENSDDMVYPVSTRIIQHRYLKHTISQISAAMEYSGLETVQKMKDRYGLRVASSNPKNPNEAPDAMIELFNQLSSTSIADRYTKFMYPTNAFLKLEKKENGDPKYTDPEIAVILAEAGVSGSKISKFKVQCNAVTSLECPAIFLQIFFDLHTSKDLWGKPLLWDRTNYQFYSSGPNRTNDSLAANTDDIPGWY